VVGNKYSSLKNISFNKANNKRGLGALIEKFKKTQLMP
jgi:hypothetical protein